MSQKPPSRQPKTFLADWLRRNFPTREQMAANKYLKPIAHRFLSPELWRFTRRSVPRGVALGMFAAFIVPVGQIFLAAFLALPARANVPLSALVTFITNPFTLPFWLIIANKTGSFVLKIDAATMGAANEQISSGRWQQFGWFLETAGVTAFGFVVLSVVSAAIGYVISSFVWRFIVARRRQRRLRQLEIRMNERLTRQPQNSAQDHTGEQLKANEG
ncbi:DUF2062 domain-containing protein [Altererythrobacter confluentis]|uniref:DUF2062 domain-containing protein n=1 Tax=Allopontixanthobacter confluentis TaxID=1849021 RepID=A0A6L7GED2_9SPHN|nr:DUF2062 domain-containing protein [Allopontixanthobacter confluentis]MXP14403.1 DUF2062 domain-containing protein [Allopontixanthobacter confluentis]